MAGKTEVIYEQKRINVFKAAKIPQVSNITFNAVRGKVAPTQCINSTPISIQYLSQIHCK